MSSGRQKYRQLWAVDNLEGLATVDAASVKLAYLDPPFNSGRAYEAVAGGGGFNDSWRWTDETDRLLARLGNWLNASTASLVAHIASSLRHDDVAAYLVTMAPRLSEIARTLREDGSLYVHCDPTASHYLKVLLDQILGPDNFRSEIIWKRTHAHSSSRRYGPIHDTILFYSKGPKYDWNPVYAGYRTEYLDKFFTHEDDAGRYQLITCTAPGSRLGTRAHYEWRGKLPPPGRHWAWKAEQMEEFERQGRLMYSANGTPRLKRYVGDGQGVPLQDVWIDINRLDAHSEERIGFETQKPLALIERIIAASSNAGDLVLDPFCGSGTTLVAAERMGRDWVGMDSSLLACSIALARVRQEVNLGRVRLHGFPSDRKAALSLLRSQPHAFGVWGTSMLAALIDRTAVNPTLATGTGRLRMQDGRTRQIVTWVPLQSRVDALVPRVKAGRLSKVGLVLRSRAGRDGLRGWLEQQLDFPIQEVPLDSLVTPAALTTGLAPYPVPTSDS